ncbi:MAG TPA: excinuclease ABC subunit UvrC [Polyangiaceae bacterium]|nr:excinuclease ABC subunit UvrC [Polyangiaceae bacterium]
MSLPETLQSKLDSLPAKPGVYIFKDKKAAILYVGKAKSLRSRVRSYFQEGASDNRQFLPFLQKQVTDLETRVTASEKEAAILEASLVKQYQPKFNVKLRDDKNFISLRLGLDHAWPRLEVARVLGRAGASDAEVPSSTARYFGPYHSATAARRALGLVNKHFQLRTCSDLELQSRKRPCLQYQIKRCPGPCVFDVDKAWYADQVRAVAMFLDGRHDELSRELVAKMKEAAQDARFELAAVYRDQLRAIESVREEQRIVTEDLADRDVIGFYREADLAEIALLSIREGRLADVMTFSLKNAEIPDEEIVSGFLTEHYGERLDVPPEIVVPLAFEGEAGFEEWKKTKVILPKRGARVQLLDLARENARHAFVEKSRTTDDVQERLAQLQERLRLPTLPRRIECCDISHLGGGDVVGAVVAMQDGQLDKKHYRTFNVKGPAGSGAHNDDYGAMYEVLARRFRRGQRAREAALAESAVVAEASGAPSSKDADTEWELPDLFVVDGGRGQLAVALAAARDLGLHNLPVVGLAKERPIGPTKDGEPPAKEEDRVYLPNQKNAIPLKSHSASLFFLARLRDEAHRFSNRARERVGKARRFKSALDDLPGIGPALKRSLLTTLGSVAAIRAATDEELLRVPGVRPKHIAVLRTLRAGEKSLPP